MALKLIGRRCCFRLPTLRIMTALSLAILLFTLIPRTCAIPQLDEVRCELTVRSWSEKELAALQNHQKLKLRDLLFFLHIPRTGGRTYHQCFLRRNVECTHDSSLYMPQAVKSLVPALWYIHFLKHLFGYDERCPRSYDKLRFDTSRPGCRLISTHDDYSILRKLPDGKASVITNLREPVGRVLSSYEFSVEVAARFLRHYKSLKTRAESSVKETPITHPLKTRTGTRLMSTLDIWPWKYLVPFFQKDVFARRDAREAGLLKSAMEVPFNNSYDVESIVMPFHEFIHHPVAHQLVHNGATFQVAGLTNNSYVPEAKEIRACVVDHQHLGHFVLEVAKRRLDNMLYVGLTDKQKESVTFFANVLRGQLSLKHTIRDPQKTSLKASVEKGPYGPRNPRHKVSADGEKGFSTHTLPVSDVNDTSEVKDEDLIDSLLKSYHGCVADLRYTQENRRVLSLELVAPINFTKKERKLIPESVIAQVVQLNSLDVELYSHAQLLFAKQQYVLEHGLSDTLLAASDEKPSHVSSQQVNFVEQHEYPLQSMQQSLSIVIGVAILVSLSGLILSVYVLRKKKSLRERTSIRVLHPLFMKVHEKI